MTTAHRPTWKAAVGQANEGGWSAGGAVSTARSALDAPAHTTLKTRHSTTNDRKEALKKSLLELEQAEKQSGKQLPKREYDEAIEEQGRLKLLKQTAEVDDVKLKAKYDDSDVDDGGGSSDSDASTDLDKEDEESDLDRDSENEDSDSDDDSDEDDEAALQAELAKIRAEREEAKKKAQAEADAEEQAKLEESALLGNPLLNSADSTADDGLMKRRRWNEDVVFRNQAKGEPALKKRFINDTVRNDFHKRFLNKFIR